MYEILGLRALLKYYAWLAAILMVVVAWWRWPIASPAQLLSIGFTGVSLAALVFAALGETAIFPYLCRRWPLSLVFPDIDGNWEGVTRSNWPIVSRRLESSGVESAEEAIPDLLETPVQVRFTCRLLHISMELVSDGRYSDSQTLAAQITRLNTTRWAQIAYVFRNTTRVPKPTDEQFHLGAGCLDIIKTGGRVELHGLYWTNRNWTLGLNTAGEILLHKAG